MLLEIVSFYFLLPLVSFQFCLLLSSSAYSRLLTSRPSPLASPVKAVGSNFRCPRTAEEHRASSTSSAAGRKLFDFNSPPCHSRSPFALGHKSFEWPRQRSLSCPEAVRHHFKRRARSWEASDEKSNSKFSGLSTCVERKSNEEGGRSCAIYEQSYQAADGGGKNEIECAKKTIKRGELLKSGKKYRRNEAWKMKIEKINKMRKEREIEV